MRLNYCVIVIQHLKPKFHNCLVISPFMFFVSIMQAAYLVIMKYWNVLSNAHPLFLNESIKPLLLSFNYRTTGHFSLLFLKGVSFFFLFFLQVLGPAAPLRPFCSMWTYLSFTALGFFLPLRRKQEVCGLILGAKVLLPCWCSDCCWHWCSWCDLLTRLAEATEKDGNMSRWGDFPSFPKELKYYIGC